MSTLTLLLSTTLAFAPVAPEASPSDDTHQDADADAYQGSEGEVSHYEFPDDELTGERLSPDGVLIPWQRPPTHPSLINLRSHFLPELMRLALDL